MNGRRKRMEGWWTEVKVWKQKTSVCPIFQTLFLLQSEQVETTVSGTMSFHFSSKRGVQSKTGGFWRRLNQTYRVFKHVCKCVFVRVCIRKICGTGNTKRGLQMSLRTKDIERRIQRHSSDSRMKVSPEVARGLNVTSCPVGTSLHLTCYSQHIIDCLCHITGNETCCCQQFTMSVYTWVLLTSQTSYSQGSARHETSQVEQERCKTNMQLIQTHAITT